LDFINVLALSSLQEKDLCRIKAVSPRLRVTDASHLVPQTPFKSEPPDPAKEQELDRLLKEAEVLFLLMPPRDVIARAPRLKWIQTISAGVDRTLTPDIAASPVIMTNVSGMHAAPISEFVFTMILTFAKNFPRYLKNQEIKKWERYPSEVLEGKTLGILGLGSIGRRIAHLGRACGMRVVATRRHVKKICRARDVDVVYPREQINLLLAESDFVVDCLPYTPETDKFIGEKELRQMKPAAIIINIGRGRTIDEEALIRALEEKWIAGAGLDTFEREPLPPESPLWELPNVIVTPHMSGWTDDYGTKAAAIFCENLKRYVEGRKLFNVVDKKLRY
jgi:phosphoglycerate dehydrogenase-like enzyme